MQGFFFFLEQVGRLGEWSDSNASMFSIEGEKEGKLWEGS